MDPDLERRTVTGRPVVCIQGLGFAGTAMAAAVASRKDSQGSPVFTVIGVEPPKTTAKDLEPACGVQP